MSLAPWRSPLSRAIHRNRSQPHSSYLQLATVTKAGRPANRTVVFRGFLQDTNQLQIVTDSRSKKIVQIEHQPWGEACWYFTKTREQFRLAGKLTIVKADHPDKTLQEARQAAWQKLSDSARLQFTWPAPGQPKTENIEAFSSPPTAANKPLPNFCLLLLNPEQVDHLDLRGEPQNRWLYNLDDSQTWFTQQVNP
ncbi:MAG: Npun_F5749 family FMN-dependent PPOX-type flavoprotein [Xenococcaceae cyanobacterium]